MNKPNTNIKVSDKDAQELIEELKKHNIEPKECTWNGNTITYLPLPNDYLDSLFPPTMTKTKKIP